MYTVQPEYPAIPGPTKSQKRRVKRVPVAATFYSQRLRFICVGEIVDLSDSPTDLASRKVECLRLERCRVENWVV